VKIPKRNLNVCQSGITEKLGLGKFTSRKKFIGTHKLEKYMILKGMFALTLIVICFTLHAQEKSINTGTAFGIQLNQYQKDFGIGVNVTSPYFIHERIALRLRANLMYNEHEKDGTTTTWSPYSNVSLGLIGVSGKVGEHIKLYGEGGFIMLFPSSDFSSDQSAAGAYGLFGFEFYMNSGHNYFIEIGGVGQGSTADKIPMKPIYSNGLLISTGFRMQLK
jgi:hypothetical protein